jgi:hypothetical protein
MTKRVQKILTVALVLVALRAEAAVTITPASPTSQDSITSVIDVAAGCGDIITTSVTGTSIRTDIVQQGCVFGPPAFTIPEAAQFGPLAPGTYTYDVFLDFEHTGPVLFSRRTIVVAPAVPGLSELGLVILAMSLAGVACFALDRRL